MSLLPLTAALLAPAVAGDLPLPEVRDPTGATAPRLKMP